MKRLECKIQNYKWGKKGFNGIVAQLNNKPEAIKNDEAHAELWMGTHINGPSKIKNEDLTLLEYINKNKHLLGLHEQNNLKFLFKVLSVENSLSIQSHPTKEQAIKLNLNDPKNYPDNNHKPEMAIALTNFELLCGFKNFKEILLNIKLNKEFNKIINSDDIEQYYLINENSDEEKCKNVLKLIFTKIWTCSDDLIKSVWMILFQVFYKEEEKTDIDNLILLLNNQFPNDIGIIAPLFLNYFTLKLVKLHF